jgi:hypothetical protein
MFKQFNREKLYYFIYVSIGKYGFLNRLIFESYRHVLIPLLKTFFLITYSDSLINIEIRNSLLDYKNFNFVLSDIDSTLIIKDGSDSKKIINLFIKIKKVLIMLDYPEIYTLSEFEKLKLIKSSASWPVTELFWNIRKINWMRISIYNNDSLFNKIKMERSVRKSLTKIVKDEINISKKQYLIADFKYFEKMFDVSRENTFISCYSEFLANNNSIGISIELSNLQFCLFNYLIPGETTIDGQMIELKDRDFYFDCKKSIWDFEILILKSSIRLNQAQNKSVDHLIKFLNFLEIT